ncbi:hypothetical protein JHK86_001152 [Glycine max]|nr:hypothetical protein JHK86_001152 [Glycine max]
MASTQRKLFLHRFNAFPNSFIYELEIVFINLKHTNNTDLRVSHSQHTDLVHDKKLENFKVTTCSRKFNNKHMVQEFERPLFPYLW